MSAALAFASAAAASGSSSTITAVALNALGFASGTSTAGIRFNPNGSYGVLDNGSYSNFGNYVSPSSAASEWEIRATVASGATPSGPIGTWDRLSFSQTWELSVTGSSLILISNLTFEFRRVGGSTAEFTVTGNTIEVQTL